ncbi:hypothetical protein V6L77_03335 [Pannonibacter sp. Pt2-lr]
MEKLLELIEKETDMVREGQLRAAGELQPEKAVLVHHYTQGVLFAKEHSVALGNLAPAAVQSLRRQHAEFQPVLRINLAVLSTAREVASTVVTTVAQAVGARQRTTTYGPGGASPHAPGLLKGSLSTDRFDATTRSLASTREKSNLFVNGGFISPLYFVGDTIGSRSVTRRRQAWIQEQSGRH